MNNFIHFYQHIPYYTNPIAIRVGFFSITWYSLMYVAAFVTVYLLLLYRAGKKENPQGVTGNIIFDYLLWAYVGLIIGARIGEVLFYNPAQYFQNPLSIVSPYDFAAGKFVGIYGMSYHGGAIGVILATWLFLKRRNINFWQFSDFVVPAIGAGYFWGRIGNFINGELYGRITQSKWGMFFSTDPANYAIASKMRYPSQLLEALLEGIVLFLILWAIRNKGWAKGKMLIFYIIGYSFFRIIGEFFREPDGYVFGPITIGQFLSLIFIFIALIAWRKRKNMV